MTKLKTTVIALLCAALLCGCADTGTPTTSQVASTTSTASVESVCSDCSDHEHESEAPAETPSDIPSEATESEVPTEEPTEEPSETPAETPTPAPTATPTPRQQACDHSYTTQKVAVTCTADGYTLHTCSKCGYSYKSDTVKSKGHSYNWTVTKAATCNAAGTRTGVCSVCGKSTTESVAKTGHSYEYVKSVSSGTCASGSSYDLYKCKSCGAEEKRNESKSGHKWVSTGEISRKVIDDRPAHVVSMKCSVCGETKTEPTGEYCYDFQNKWKAKIIAPTCTEQGYTVYTCTCGFTWESDYTPATGNSHTYGSWSTIQNASASEGRDKIEVRTCTKCGSKDYRETSIDGKSVNRDEWTSPQSIHYLFKGYTVDTTLGDMNFGVYDYRANLTTAMEVGFTCQDELHIIVYWHDANGTKHERVVCRYYNGESKDKHEDGAGVKILADGTVQVSYIYNP